MRKTWRNNVYPFKSSEKIDCQKIKILNEWRHPMNSSQLKKRFIFCEKFEVLSVKMQQTFNCNHFFRSYHDKSEKNFLLK
jgi:hypothetical protein